MLPSLSTTYISSLGSGVGLGVATGGGGVPSVLPKAQNS